MHTMDKPLKVPGERQAPLYFAGRRDELAELDEKLRDLCATGDPTNGLQLTVGVLGQARTPCLLQNLTHLCRSAPLKRLGTLPR